uniref:Uncharacterized protein n=1 Tax=Timema shepardi TaxID=629360 RepID=A0A7R9AR82_TIMSH|nr:unnamed protein product [Timema shepardi]
MQGSAGQAYAELWLKHSFLSDLPLLATIVPLFGGGHCGSEALGLGPMGLGLGFAPSEYRFPATASSKSRCLLFDQGIIAMKTDLHTLVTRVDLRSSDCRHLLPGRPCLPPVPPSETA